MAGLIGRAKKLKREGVFPEEAFKEIKIESSVGVPVSGPCSGIEIIWDNGKLIRFSQVEHLFDFLRAVGGSCTAAGCPIKKGRELITFNRRTSYTALGTWPSWTQEELAGKLDCEITTIQAYEQKRRHPSLPTLLMLCKILKLKLSVE